MGKDVQWKKKYIEIYRAPFASTAKMAYFGPSCATSSTSPFWQRFQWFQRTWCKFENHFSKIEAHHPKTHNWWWPRQRDMSWPFFQEPDIEEEMCRSQARKRKSPIFPAVLGGLALPLKNASFTSTGTHKAESRLQNHKSVFERLISWMVHKDDAGIRGPAAMPGRGWTPRNTVKILFSLRTLHLYFWTQAQEHSGMIKSKEHPKIEHDRAHVFCICSVMLCYVIFMLCYVIISWCLSPSLFLSLFVARSLSLSRLFPTAASEQHPTRFCSHRQLCPRRCRCVGECLWEPCRAVPSASTRVYTQARLADSIMNSCMHH